MTRVTFGVAASSYAANMAVKQNAAEFALEFPAAAKAVDESFYVDDGLTGVDSVDEAVALQRQLQELFARGGFVLRKWNSSNPAVLEHISDDLKDAQALQTLPDDGTYTKTLGVEWNTVMDHFRLKVAELSSLDTITKRFLVSDVAKMFDVLGWYSPCTIKMKILFQQLWEMKIGWDDEVPESVRESWLKWRSELNLLSTKHVPRCYHDKTTFVVSMELHGFSDASEHAYSAVVYLRMECSDGSTQIGLVSSKTKVAPITRLTIPRLELCGAQLLAKLLHHTRHVLDLSIEQSHAWTDSTIVLHWLIGSPKRFKTFVGNRVGNIVELLGPERWHHVSGMDNPADCASRGLFPSELIDHTLWWEGPAWLKLPSSQWPEQSQVPETYPIPEEEKEITFVAVAQPVEPLIPFDRFSSFNHLKRVTAWILRFIENCRANARKVSKVSSHLTVSELQKADVYWLTTIQGQHFGKEITSLKKGRRLRKSSPLIPLHPFLDDDDLIRVGGREDNSNRAYSNRHPVVLHGSHLLTRLIIRT